MNIFVVNYVPNVPSSPQPQYFKSCQTRHVDKDLSVAAASPRLHAEDVSLPVDRQDDRPRQLQLGLQETSHLLGVEHVAEHPDLRPVPLDVGVARGHPGSAHRPAQSPPHLLDVLRRPTVVLSDHPLGPLAEVQPVGGHHAIEQLGQGLLRRDSSRHRGTPGAFERRGPEGAVFVFLWRDRSLCSVTEWRREEKLGGF